MAVNYGEELTQDGRLSKEDEEVREFLDFVIRAKRGDVVDRAKRLLEEA